MTTNTCPSGVICQTCTSSTNLQIKFEVPSFPYSSITNVYLGPKKLNMGHVTPNMHIGGNT